jgi:hypothetical protein
MMVVGKEVTVERAMMFSSVRAVFGNCEGLI